MTIYIVTDGDYSDYHIVGVYSSEEQAKRMIEGSASIEEWELDEYVKDDRIPYLIRICDDYVDAGISTESFSYDREYNKVLEFKTPDYSWTPDYQKKSNKTYSVYVHAKDKEHAIKIASDLIAQYKANV